MKKIAILIASVLVFGFAMAANADQAHQGHDMSEMTDTSKSETGSFKHEVVVDGVRAEFQVMSLASMNLTDESGATHHVMVKFIDENENKQIHLFKGENYGKVSTKARGTSGFGFDPIFISSDTPDFTFAELKIEEKNLISHRRRAMMNFIDFLKKSN